MNIIKEENIMRIEQTILNFINLYNNTEDSNVKEQLLMEIKELEFSKIIFENYFPFINASRSTFITEH